MIAWCISILFASIFQSNPISGIWLPYEPHTHVNYAKYLVGTAVPNVTTDFVILVLPVSMVWQLQLSKRRKIALCGVFLLGTLYAHRDCCCLVKWLTAFPSVCVVSIIRAYTVATLDKTDASCKPSENTQCHLSC